VLLLTVLLTGCGGTLALLFKLVSVGQIVGNVTDLVDRFGKSSTEYAVFFDGFPLGQRPDNTGRLDLRGLPAGKHLISVIDGDYRTGFHQTVDITPGDDGLQLSGYNPVQGAVISGRVERETSGGGRSQVAHTLVVAIFNGASMLQNSGGSIISIPPPDESVEYIMGYTDSTGTYRLGPAKYGSWLVTTTLPGHYGDARVVVTSGGGDSRNQNLMLTAQQANPVGTIMGSVTRSATQGIADALVYTQLQEPYRVQVTSQCAAEVANDSGFALIQQPWFAWTVLGTVTDQSGAYSLSSRMGRQTVTAFKYGYRAKSWEGDPGLGTSRIDFDLSAR
jgi:hypothetical protein